MVGVTERVRRRFLNFKEAASWGGEGTKGRLRSDEYDGGGAEAKVDLWDCDDVWKDRGSLEGPGDDDWKRGCDGAGELARVMGLSARALNRFVRNSCSNCFERSRASKERAGCGANPGRSGLRGRWFTIVGGLSRAAASDAASTSTIFLWC